MKTDYVWEAQYKAVVLETNPETLPKRIQAAEAALDSRLHEIQLDHGGTSQERQAITDAFNGLKRATDRIRRLLSRYGVKQRVKAADQHC